MQVDGSCFCGDIRFEAEVAKERVGICHCTDCQTFSGSAFRTSVFVPGGDLRLLAGTPSLYEKTSERGSPRQLAFCGRCGTHLWGAAGGDAPPFYSVRVGVLAQRAELPPVVQVWCRSALPWLPALPGRRVETQ
jgi:hypothetical protein